MAKLNREERALAASVERGEWRSVSGLKSARARYQTYAKATFKKDRRVNIRISGKDLSPGCQSNACSVRSLVKIS